MDAEKFVCPYRGESTCPPINMYHAPHLPSLADRSPKTIKKNQLGPVVKAVS